MTQSTRKNDVLIAAQQHTDITITIIMKNMVPEEHTCNIFNDVQINTNLITVIKHTCVGTK